VTVFWVVIPCGNTASFFKVQVQAVTARLVREELVG